MSTSSPKGPGTPFSEQELEAVTAGPTGDPEIEELEPADIDDPAVDLETHYEKLVQKSRKLSPERISCVVESLLFVSDKPLSLDQLHEATGVNREKLLQGLDTLSGKCREGVSGVVLHEVAGGWQLRTDPDSAEYVRSFLRVKPQRLTRAAVESLAIIAYRQPVTRPEIEDIRGVDSGAVIKALLDRRLIKILGKKEEVGRPILYGTTREFLEFFALKDLSALPTLREFQELTEEHQEIVEKEAPFPPVEGTVAALQDTGFKAKLEADHQASESALAELETAIATADHRTRVAADFLAGPKPPPPPADGDEPADQA